MPPDYRNFNGYGPQVVSRLDLTKQYVGTVKNDGGLTISERSRSGGAWTTHTITGANSTTLGLPFADDSHNTVALAVDGTGRLHLWANYHNNALTRYLVSTQTGGVANITSWSDGPQPPTTETRNSYISPIMLADGRIVLFLRAGPTGSGAGNADWFYWILSADGVTWSARTRWLQGIGAALAGDADGNSSAYPHFHYEAHASGPRIHASWVWRGDGTVARDNTIPSYAWLDVNSGVWKSKGGTTLTLPITSTNNTSVQMRDSGNALIVAGVEGYLNGGGMCLDASGNPVMVVSQSPPYVIAWTGSAWQQTSLGTAAIGGAVIHSRINCVLVNGEVHYLGTTASSVSPYRLCLWRNVGGTYCIRLGPQASVVEQTTFDPVAHRLLGAVEVSVPDGDTPNIATFGAGARLR